MKKLISFLVAMTMVVGMIPVMVTATTTSTPTPVPTSGTAKVYVGELITTDNGNGTVTSSIDVTYTDLDHDTIKFMVTRCNAKGEVVEAKEQVKAVAAGGPVAETFEVTLDSAPAQGEKIKYYLWGDDKVSLIDNAPSRVKDFTATSKIKGIRLSWAPSFDDSGSEVLYRIYRENVLIGETLNSSYFAPGSPLTAHTYSIVPVDINANSANAAVSDAVKTKLMYYNNPSGSNGLAIQSMGPSSDAYSVVGNIGGVNAYTSDMVYTDKSRYIYFRLTKDCDITSADSELVFEIDYYDKGTGNLELVYNRIIGSGEIDNYIPARQRVVAATRTNTQTWKTTVVRVTNAALRNSAYSLAASFGILIPTNTPAGDIAIREIRVCKAEDYE